MKFRLRIFVSILVFNYIVSGPFNTYAEDTTIVEGRVIDLISGDPIIGVTVILKGHKIYAVTDINGHYSLINVPVGQQTIIFQMMGYENTIAELNALLDKKNELNISLSYKTAKEVVVVARRISNTEASLLSKRKKAPAPQDAISSEQISKSPDSDAADAAKRVTGVTIVNGKNVFIRGLGERYSSVMFAGSVIPSPNPDKRVVPLDIFPVGLLDNLVIIKSYMPDISGEFAGGVVQINPKDYPDETTLKVSAGTGYHAETTGKDFLTYDGGKRDWFGVDDGSRDKPDIIGDSYFNDVNYSTPEIERAGEKFKNEYTPDTTNGKLPAKISFSYGDSYKFADGKTIGIILSGMFKESSKNKTIELLRVNDNFYTIKDYSIDKSVYSTDKGVLLSLAYTGKLNKLRMTGFYSHQSDDSTSIYTGYNNDRNEPTISGAHSSAKIYRLQYIETGLLFSQLAGEHYLNKLLNTTIQWNASYSRATRDEPDSRRVQLIDANSTGEFFIYRSDDVDRVFQNHTDSVMEFTPTLSIPFKQWMGLNAKLKIGGAYSYRERESEQRSFTWDNDGSLGSLSTTGEYIEQIYNPSTIVGSVTETDSTHYYIKEVSGQNDSYTGKLKLFSGFGMIDIPLIRNLRLVGGLRYEYSDMDVLTFNPIYLIEKDLENEPLKKNNLMPGFCITYSIKERTNIRIAFSKTVARPDFREVTEFKYSTMLGNEVIVGNPELEQCDIYNYDIRYEYFPSVNEIIAVSIFYKNLQKPIEMLEVTGQPGTATFKYQNAETAHNMGLELEIRKGLGFITKSLNDITLLLNVAYIYSEIDVKDTELAKYSNKDRALQGQSPYIINASMNYNNEKIGLFTSLLYNIQGPRIMRVGTIYSDVKRGDVYEESAGKLDLVLAQKIFDGGKLKLSFENILDPKIKQTQKRNNATTGEEKEFTMESFRDGRSISISYSQSL
ncbi:MAG: carboxypeptidase-like regulatory domain-containing protein [Spirochaetota bacterium]|nr:carboxypeptidase-like regulatory domain-containing protein [Spirochaetota bacterium]